MSKKSNYIAIFITICFLIAMIPFVYNNIKENKKPSYSEMRSYVISKLTDDQIRKIRKESYERAAYEKRRNEENYEKEHQEKLALLQKCNADPAYKERNPWDCHIPITWASPDGGKVIDAYENPDIVYDEMIMGVCNDVSTIRDAKKHGCLPS